MNLEYEEFVSEFLEALKENMPEAYFERKEVEKVNGTRDTIKVHLPEFKNVLPTVGIDSLYQSYQMGNPPDAIAKQLSQDMLAVAKKTANTIVFDTETAKEKLFPCVVSMEMNQKLLANVPHKDIEGTDLALVARYLAEDTGNQMVTCLITNSNSHLIGMEPKEALEQAIANGAQEKYVCTGMLNFLGDEIQKTGVPEEKLGNFYNDEKNHCYILSNEKMIQGAAVLGYLDEIKKATESFGKENCYILPSSIHEIILIPESNIIGGTPEQLADMVKSINETEVKPEEQLSGHVYFFDGESLCIADTQTLSPKTPKASGIEKNKAAKSKEQGKAEGPTR